MLCKNAGPPRLLLLFLLAVFAISFPMDTVDTSKTNRLEVQQVADGLGNVAVRTSELYKQYQLATNSRLWANFETGAKRASWSSRPCKQWQVLPLLYSSERLNTWATHIQCCPGQPRCFWRCHRAWKRGQPIYCSVLI